MKGHTNEARYIYHIDYNNILESSIIGPIPKEHLVYAAKSKFENVGVSKSYSIVISRRECIRGRRCMGPTAGGTRTTKASSVASM